MANERLRSAVFSSGLGVDRLADEVGVDRKTVERWIGGGCPIGVTAMSSPQGSIVAAFPEGQLFRTYQDSFESIWSLAKPMTVRLRQTA